MNFGIDSRGNYLIREPRYQNSRPDPFLYLEVKVCGIGRVEDAVLAAQLGARYLGFIFHAPSPRCISLPAFRDMAGRLPDVLRVAVDVAPTPEKLEAMRGLGFDFFQIHFPLDQDGEDLAAWSERVGRDRLWLAPKVAPEDPFPPSLFAHADTFLVDTYQKEGFGGSGQTGDWARFRELKANYPQKNWILAGGLDPKNISHALTAAQPDRVDVNSGVEASPGKKSPQKLKAFFKKLPPRKGTEAQRHKGTKLEEE